MKSRFVYAGESSEEHCLTIESMPGYGAAQKNIDTYSVPGRSGALIFDTGTYQNITQPYETWLKAPEGMKMHEAARNIANWLTIPKGYQRLEDTYDPDIYRRAYFAGPLDVSNWFGRYGRCTLEFNCMPQRWLKSGEFSVAIASGDELFNEWQDSAPLIMIKGSFINTISIGNYTIGITDIPAEGLYIDCETQNAYSGLVNCNSLITVPQGFPRLLHGKNTIEFSNAITEFKIIPRWWTI